MLAWPLAARAQQPGKLLTIGFLGSTTPAIHGQWVATFVQRLRELGWIEGRSIAIEFRWAEGRIERYAEIVPRMATVRANFRDPFEYSDGDRLPGAFSPLSCGGSGAFVVAPPPVRRGSPTADGALGVLDR